MGIRSLLQFRLRTLLIVVTVLAVVLWGFLQYVRPLVADVSLNGGTLVIHLTPAASQNFMPVEDAYHFGPGSSPQNSDSTLMFLHDSYISIPLPRLAMLLAVLAAVLAVAYVMVRKAARRLTTRQ